MSEQTPESARSTGDDDALLAGDAEPSMEDILASIRKIISDDADPLPLDGPEASAPVANAPDDTTVDEMDIEALLGDLETVESDVPPSASFAESVGLGDAASADDGLAIPDMDEENADALVTASSADVTSDDDADDMDQLMDELLNSMDEPGPVPATDGPVAAAVPADGADSDMDAVKSMLADLTDEDVAPSDVSDDDAFDIDALLSEVEAMDDDTAETSLEIPSDADLSSELSDLDALLSSKVELNADALDGDALDAMEDDIFDSILDMTLDDEVAAFDAAAEADGSAPSLADIAAAADAEADVDPVVATAAVAVTAAVVAKPTPDQSDNVEAETAATETDAAPVAAKPEPAKPAPSDMETPMPSALRSDAILDDVTEQATMTAFAELNQVVEDKAILSERGPRIGDLVQDALKPMLKEWLDENIQGIVERAVAKEVKRIATGK